MSTEQELKELMGLVDSHGNACENFGYYKTIKNADACSEIRKGIETRLRALLAELEAAREDAARYRWLRDSSNKVLWDGLMQTFPFAHLEFDRKIDAARNGEA